MTEVKKTRSELKREAIIQASIEAFHKNGIIETSMDTIAQLANVSKRTVYNHFDSKETLVTQIFKEMWKKSQTLVGQTYQTDATLEQQLVSILQSELKYMSCPTYIEKVRFALGYFIHKPEEMCEYSDEFMKAETNLKIWIKAAVADGKLKELNVETANDQLVSLLKDRAFWPQVLRRDPCLTDTEQKTLIADSVGMFLSYYQK